MSAATREISVQPGRTPSRAGIWSRLRLSTSAYVGASMLLVFVLAGLFGPLIAPYDPLHMDLDHIFEGRSGAHWLGTDQNGYDVVSQLLYGARIALEISMSVVLVSAFIGVSLGVMAGYFGGWVDEVVMFFINVLMSFPGILLNIAIVAVADKPGVGTLIIALTVNGWVGYARVARGQVFSLREREFVSAARCMGAGSWLIMRRYIVPNLLSPIMVQMTFAFGSVILVEASLSFLGLGPQVEYTWGAMLYQGATFLWRPGSEHFAMIPGAAIMLVVLGANLFGDGLRDRLDPRHKERAG